MIKNIVILNAVLYSTLLCASEQPLLTTQLNSAIEKFDVQEVEHLLQQGASAVAPVDDKGTTPIKKLVAWTACEMSHPKQVDSAAKIALLLLQKGADPNSEIDGESPFQNQQQPLVGYLACWLCAGLAVYPLIEPFVYDLRFTPYKKKTDHSVDSILKHWKERIALSPKETMFPDFDREAFCKLEDLILVVAEKRDIEI